MRPRSFKGTKCVYCARETCESADHVFAREFFPKDDRGDTPKVPACNRCNGTKAALERYATLALSFGSRHPAAVQIMTDEVPRRLRGNRDLARDLAKNQGRALVEEPNGLLLPATTFKIDNEKISELMRYIVQGLVWHHWGSYLQRSESVIDVRIARVEGDSFTRAMFDGFIKDFGASCRHESANLGHGTARYEAIGATPPGQPVVSVWRIQLLESIYFLPAGPARGFMVTTTQRLNSSPN